MTTYIALLRGINVGGRNKLPMKELIEILENLGCRNVKTYIQSGNVAFEKDKINLKSFSEKISVAIEMGKGFTPKILLLTLDEMRKAIAENPFPEAVEEPKALHFGFLASVPSEPDIEKLEGYKKESEQFILKDKVFYLYAPEGVGRSRLAANSERALGVSMTDRNYRTVSKIIELIN